MSGRRRPSPPHPSLSLAWPPAAPVALPPRPLGAHGPLRDTPFPTEIAPIPEPGEICKSPKHGEQAILDPYPRAGRGCSGKSRPFAPTGPARPAEPRRSLPPSHRTVGRSGFARGSQNKQPRRRQKENPVRCRWEAPTSKAQLSLCHSLVTSRLNCCEFEKTHCHSLATVSMEDPEIVTTKRAL